MIRCSKHANGERVYIVYEGRAASGDTEDAGILESFSATDDHQAQKIARKAWRQQQFVLYGCTFRGGVAIEDESPLYKHWC